MRGRAELVEAMSVEGPGCLLHDVLKLVLGHSETGLHIGWALLGRRETVEVSTTASVEDRQEENWYLAYNDGITLIITFNNTF